MKLWSRIGVAFYPLPISQTINLGRCSHLLGHIKHEMMHTVGFYHEHSRSDRDKYIQVHSSLHSGRRLFVQLKNIFIYKKIYET